MLSKKELLPAGKNVAYDEIMDAVADFDSVNAKLAAILNQLSAENDLKEEIFVKKNPPRGL